MDYLLLPLVRRVLDGVDDVLVAGAAAEVAGDALPDLLLGRLRRVVQEVDRRHDHARGAEAALEAVLFPEAFLQGVQLAVLGQAFNRRDLRAIGLDGEDGARLGAAAVDEHRAGTALAGVAADVGAGQEQLLAEEVDEEQPGFHVRFSYLAIDGHRDVSHMSPLRLRH